MSVYIVTGKLGSGKNLAAVGRIRYYLERGLPVATNIQLDLLKLMGSRQAAAAARVTRLPDFPSPADLEVIGRVDNENDEDKNGALVLDECGVLLNAREWGDKGRQAIIDWLLHSRKLGWDVYLIVQNLSLLDKQLRDALAEFVVVVRRMDRIAVPIIGTAVRVLTFGLVRLKLPRLHVASVTYGAGPTAFHSDTWTFRGTDLFGAYPTKQRFTRFYEDGPYSFWVAPGEPAKPVGVHLKPKLRVVELLMGLPEQERLRHWRRLEAHGFL